MFANEGLTIKDLVSQLEYGNEYRTLIQFQHEYKTINDTNYVGASVGTFSFENSMYPQFLQDIKKLPSTLNDIPPLTNGILLIPLNSVIIKSTKLTNYFSSNGQNTSLTVDQNVTGPLITISVNIAKSIQGINSQVIGMNQLTSVIQQRILILPFIQIDDTI